MCFWPHFLDSPPIAPLASGHRESYQGNTQVILREFQETLALAASILCRVNYRRPERSNREIRMVSMLLDLENLQPCRTMPTSDSAIDGTHFGSHTKRVEVPNERR